MFALAFSLDKVADRLLRARRGLTLSLFRILIALKFLPKTSQRSVADFWGITEASASRQIDILVKKKLLDKSRNPDNQREYLLALTPRGAKELKTTIGILDGAFEKLFREVNPKERLALSSLLRRLLDLLRKSHAPTS